MIFDLLERFMDSLSREVQLDKSLEAIREKNERTRQKIREIIRQIVREELAAQTTPVPTIDGSAKKEEKKDGDKQAELMIGVLDFMGLSLAQQVALLERMLVILVRKEKSAVGSAKPPEEKKDE